jgi:hypothetical protein
MIRLPLLPLPSLAISKPPIALPGRFTCYWEAKVAPATETAFEWPDSVDALASQQQRHTGAGGFIRSRTVKNDVPIHGDLGEMLVDLIGIKMHGPRQG